MLYKIQFSWLDSGLSLDLASQNLVQWLVNLDHCPCNKGKHHVYIVKLLSH